MEFSTFLIKLKIIYEFKQICDEKEASFIIFPELRSYNDIFGFCRSMGAEMATPRCGIKLFVDEKTFNVFAFAHRTPEDQESLFNVTRPFVGEVDLSNKMCNTVPQIVLLFFSRLARGSSLAGRTFILKGPSSVRTCSKRGQAKIIFQKSWSSFGATGSQTGEGWRAAPR